MIYEQTKAACLELIRLERADVRPVRLLVIGASSSEVGGGQIGKASQPQLGGEIARAALDAAREFGVDVAFQCCEHLNRRARGGASRGGKIRFGARMRGALSQGGGSVASAAYRMMDEPVVVESLQADAGIDIGDTLIGMHLKPVAVPVRLAANLVGEARVVAARTRAKLIGGERAKYNL